MIHAPKPWAEPTIINDGTRLWWEIPGVGRFAKALDAELARSCVNHQDELVRVVQLQHRAIDILFARLIQLTGKYEDQGEPLFYPSQSGKPWAAIEAGHDVMMKVKAKP